MADRNGLKGNPASKRISNVAAKNKRARSWARRERRREEIRKAQHVQEHQNKLRKIRSELTPWQCAKALRFARRHDTGITAAISRIAA